MEILVGAVIAAVVGGAIALYYRYSDWGLLRRARRVPIAQIREGALAKIVGRVCLVEAPVQAPLSARACAHCHVLVEQRRSRGKSSYWKTLVDERRSARQFMVEDETGRALVHTDGATFLLDLDVELRSGWLNDPTPELEAFLTSHGIESQGLLFNKRLRYREGVLEVGETIAVLGMAHLEPDPDPSAVSGGFREHPLRPWLAAGKDTKLLISDKRSVLG